MAKKVFLLTELTLFTFQFFAHDTGWGAAAANPPFPRDARK